MTDESKPDQIARQGHLLLASAAERAGEHEEANHHKLAALMGQPLDPIDKPAPGAPTGPPPRMGPTGKPVPPPYEAPRSLRGIAAAKLRHLAAEAEQAGDWSQALKLKAKLIAQSRSRR